VPSRWTLVGAIVLVASLPACRGGPVSPPIATSPGTGQERPSAEPESPSPSPALESPSPESPSPEPSPTPTLDPLGPSRARLTVTGDIETRLNLPLVAFDAFSATWCDARNCANAANTLQIMGEGFGEPGQHETPREVFVTIEVQDRFLYVSGAEHIQGDCTVTFTAADERGVTGEIVCRSITNGTGIGVLTLSVRGTFVAAS
jgi:hypothetical protein